MIKKVSLLLLTAILLSACKVTSETVNLAPTTVETPIPGNNNEVEKLLNIKENQKMIATLNTSLGAIKIELFPDKAPKTVANFVDIGTHDELYSKN
ncbi:MAG: peptidylprolyl isomerase [Patescibacteria group bacterium]